MKNLTYKATIALLSNMAMLLMTTQPLVADDCTQMMQPHEEVQLVQLEHAKSVTFNYEPGQQAILAGNQLGTADLVSRSVLRIDFEPSHEAIGYGVEPVPPLDITPLLDAGSNTVRMTTVDPLDTAWIRITSPCPAGTPSAAVSQESEVQISKPSAVAQEVVSTPTPASLIEGISIASTPPVLHTQEMAKPSKSYVPVIAHEARFGTAAISGVCQMLLGLALLTLVWMLTSIAIRGRGTVRRWWQGLRPSHRDGLE